MQNLELQADLNPQKHNSKTIICHDVVLLLHRQNSAVCVIYNIMLILKTKLKQLDSVFEWRPLLFFQHFPEEKAATIQQDFPATTKLLSSNWKNGITSHGDIRIMLHVWD